MSTGKAQASMVQVWMTDHSAKFCYCKSYVQIQ